METSQKLETVTLYCGNPGLGNGSSPYVKIPYNIEDLDNQNTEDGKTKVNFNELAEAALGVMTPHENRLYLLWAYGGLRDYKDIARYMNNTFGSKLEGGDIRIGLRNVRVLNYWRCNSRLELARSQDARLLAIGGVANMYRIMSNTIIEEFNAISDIDYPSETPDYLGDNVDDHLSDVSFDPPVDVEEGYFADVSAYPSVDDDGWDGCVGDVSFGGEHAEPDGEDAQLDEEYASNYGEDAEPDGEDAQLDEEYASNNGENADPDEERFLESPTPDDPTSS
ncbi:hypothetical protein B7494_g1026 [Chlorociboria aeruginascens]|nr:hypothetical protein B7494_g1026 [Chlorociboria aeruginascens]